MQLFFSTSILPSIALKRWNFPYNLDFNVKIAAKFLIRSHFLSIWNNMAIKNKLNIGPFKKYVTYIMTFFTSFNFVTLRQLYFIIFPALLTKLHQETIQWETRRFFAYMSPSLYHVRSTEVEITSLDKIEFLDTHVCINNPHW